MKATALLLQFRQQTVEKSHIKEIRKNKQKEDRRTSLGALLVHDTVTALFAADRLLGLDFVV